MLTLIRLCEKWSKSTKWYQILYWLNTQRQTSVLKPGPETEHKLKSNLPEPYIITQRIGSPSVLLMVIQYGIADTVWELTSSHLQNQSLSLSKTLLWVSNQTRCWGRNHPPVHITIHQFTFIRHESHTSDESDLSLGLWTLMCKWWWTVSLNKITLSFLDILFWREANVKFRLSVLKFYCVPFHTISTSIRDTKSPMWYKQC